MARKNGLILLGWVIIGSVVGGVAAATMSVHQASQVPDWYAETAPADVPEPERSVESSLPADAVALSSAELQEWVEGTVANSSPELRRTAEQLNTRIEDGRLKTGTVVNLSELPIDQLRGRERELVERAVNLVPGLSNRDVFVGLEGSPSIENGQLSLDRDMVVKVGNLSLPLSVVAQQLGLSLSELEQRINQELQAKGVDIGSVEVVGDRLVIRE
ncbi:MAG: hypothetical protein KME20_14495 [Kaiparowitsia implicata GSE-PSE-MK54-09C]|jgi:hypothetical protein|nr:hypothetical protein [Kaiparowitsia implicata GSE-PSE-MK54-09C]